MSEHPLTIQEMLRRAIRAQIELGTTEFIASGMTFEPIEHQPPVSAMNLAPARKDESSTVGEIETEILELTGGTGGLSSPLGECAYDSIEPHRAAICNCKLCPLGEGRNKFVYGVGNPNAKLMFIGEAPGAQEDLQGEPFVGAAGQLLDKILAAIQLSRKEVYIANILKCRPPNNRDPLPAEVEQCLPYLHEQMRIIRPKLLCCLGRIAAHTLLQTTTPLGKLRHQWHDYHGIPMQVTYHPAALLRFPQYKRDTWEDMKALKARYDQL